MLPLRTRGRRDRQSCRGRVRGDVGGDRRAQRGSWDGTPDAVDVPHARRGDFEIISTTETVVSDIRPVDVDPMELVLTPEYRQVEGGA